MWIVLEQIGYARSIRTLVEAFGSLGKALGTAEGLEGSVPTLRHLRDKGLLCTHLAMLAALVHGGCAAFAPQQHPLGASPRVTRARAPLLCAANDRCGAISLAEVGEVAERLGCKLAVNSMGPGYKLELLWGDEMAGQMIGGDPSRAR